MTLAANRGGPVGNDGILTGEVVTIHSKGFAFFTDDDSDQEYFCPPNLVKDFKKGDAVEYQVSSQQDGREAVKVIVSVNGEKKLTIGKKILQKAKKFSITFLQRPEPDSI